MQLRYTLLMGERLAKIAVRSASVTPLHLGSPQSLLSMRALASGHGWAVSDVVCHAGPRDGAQEEQHTHICIAIVVEGSFQYQSSAGRELMTPGSLLLGSPGQEFKCGHEHGTGDRCVSFAYEAGYFENIASESEVKLPRNYFASLRVPPTREFAPLMARACVGLAASSTETAEWEEIGFELAARTLESTGGRPRLGSSLAAEFRVTRIVRMIESRPEVDHDSGSLAREAKLSRYHFLRVFQQLTGLTPHRYVMRTRLHRAATRLALEQTQILEIALSSGFGDLSNFNRAFRAEYGMSPTSYRKSLCRGAEKISSSAYRT